MLGADPLPDRRIGRGRKIGERSIGGFMRPLFDGPEGFELPGLLEQHSLPAARLLQSPSAEIISPALDQHGGKFIGINRPKQRDIPFNELFLE